MRKQKVLLFAVLVLSLIMLTTPAFAACKCQEKVTSDNYGVRAPARLVHGIVNAGLGWTEILREPVYSVKHEDQNVVDGIFDGLGGTVYYTALGAWDIATFWFPGSGGKDIAVQECVLMKKGS